MNPESAVELKNDPQFRVIEGLTTTDVIVAMNNSKPPFSDIRVRKAITYAIDRAEVIKGSVFGMAKPIGSHMDPLNLYYVDLSRLYEYDPQQAKRLLTEAGYPQGFEFVLRLAEPYLAYRRAGEIIASRLPVTFPLAGLAMSLTILVGIPLGVLAAAHHQRPGDVWMMVVSQLGIAIPSFWVGLLLILLFSVYLGWFPAGGFTAWAETPAGALRSLLLPAIALGLVQTAILTRTTRSAMLEVLCEDYVQTARSKGLSDRFVLYKHALKNGLITIVTLLGLQIGHLLVGSIIIENVFYLPGLGRLVLGAVSARDLPVVQAVVLFMATVIVFINFAVDLLYGWLDPRIRYD
jgi:peptide/nickel transport system permease protein